MTNSIYDTFAARWLHGGSIWLYSDPHFSDEEMKYLRKNYIGDEEQVKRINSKIGKHDTIIFLGDIGNVEWIKKVRGYKVLIMGNHDAGATNYQRVVNKISTFNSEELTNEDRKMIVANAKEIIQHPEKIKMDKYFHQRIEDNHLFDEVYEGPLMISDKIILSHEPLDFPPYFYNIHGHDHSKCGHNDEYHFNVCAEHIDYTPVQLSSIIRSGVLKNIDNIHRITIDEATRKKERENNE